MQRRTFLSALAAPALRGLPRLTIKNVKIIPTSPQGRYHWVFVKIETSEPGLYGLGSASNVQQAAARSVVTSPEWARMLGSKV